MPAHMGGSPSSHSQLQCSTSTCAPQGNWNCFRSERFNRLRQTFICPSPFCTAGKTNTRIAWSGRSQVVKLSTMDQVPEVPVRISACRRSLSKRNSSSAPAAPPLTSQVPLARTWPFLYSTWVTAPWATVAGQRLSSSCAKEARRITATAARRRRIPCCLILLLSSEGHHPAGLPDHPREALPSQQGIHGRLDARRVETEEARRGAAGIEADQPLLAPRGEHLTQ